MSKTKMEQRIAELEQEYQRLAKLRNEATEQMLRVEGAMLVLREMATREQPAEAETQEAEPQG